eukprot:SAG31_NODE_13348_length_875_cov_1.519330_1_plen_48_part_00
MVWYSENLVKGLAYVRIANPLKGFCECTDYTVVIIVIRSWLRGPELV